MSESKRPSSTAAPRQVDLRDHTEQILRAACRAPSLHNAQPWAFRVGPTEIEIHADHARRVPVTDPEDRQLFIGVGAAVFGLRLAVAHLGLRPVVRLAREPARPDLAAVVVAAGPAAAVAEDEALYAQLDRRRTVRGPFTDDAVPVPLQLRLTEVARGEGVTPHWLVQQAPRQALAAIVQAAERQQQSDPRFRAELARWTGAAVAQDRTGIPPENIGTTTRSGAKAQFALRDFTSGRGAQDRRPEARPGIVALCTPTDRRADWLRTGQTLHHLLLVAAEAGLAASYINQPLELPPLRSRLRAELRLPDHPQVILRIGRPAGALPPPTPRRPISDVLLP